MWIVSLIISMILALVPAKIAENKGYKYTRWYIYGFFLFGIALIHSLVLKDKKLERVLNQIDRQSNPEIVKNMRHFHDYEQGYDINAVVRISDYNIFEKSNGKLYLGIEIKNIKKQTVRAVKIKVIGYDSFGKVITENGKKEFELLIQDLSIGFREKQKIEMALSEKQLSIRECSFWVEQIRYDNGSIYECKKPEYVKPILKYIEDKYLEFAKNLSVEARYYSSEYDRYWQCACGSVEFDDICTECGTAKKIALKLSEKSIEAEYVQYKDEIKKQELLKQQEIVELEKRKKEKTIILQKKIKKISCIALSVMVCIFVGYFLFFRFLIPSFIYKSAQNSIDERNYLKAIEQLQKISFYKNSEIELIDCKLAYAESLANSKEYEIAQNTLNEVADFIDKSGQRQHLQYVQGLIYLGTDQCEKAVESFEGLEYGDSEEKLREAYIDVAYLMLWRKNQARAIEYFEKAEYYEKDYLDLCLELGQKAFENQYFDEAKEYLQKVDGYKNSTELLSIIDRGTILDDVSNMNGCWIMLSSKFEVNLLYINSEKQFGTIETINNSDADIEHQIKNFEFDLQYSSNSDTIVNNGDGTYSIRNHYYDGKADSSSIDLVKIKFNDGSIEVLSSLNNKLIGRYLKYQ